MDTMRMERGDDEMVVVRLDVSGDRVNTLSSRMMADLDRMLTELESDGSARGLVFISGKADNFIVGADVKELSKITDATMAEEVVHEVHELFYHLESLPFPTLAAIHGPCLGGGFELALACRYRIATDHPKTLLGLPEVKLGLLPGGGGTQRLTRLIGVKKALPLMLEGRTVNARRARALGMIDLAVYPHGLLDTAKACLQAFIQKPKNGSWAPRMLSLDGGLERLKPMRKIYFDMARRQVLRKTLGNYPAPLRLIDCVETGIGVGFAAGLQAEAQAFGELVTSPEARALRHLFFATTALKKNPLEVLARPVKRVGVLGAGLMGSGIAAVTAQGGLPVVLKDVSWENLTRGLRNIWTHLDGRVRRDRRNPVERDKLYSLVTPSMGYEALKRADVVIEAVFEDLALKHQVLRETEAHTDAECIFASNTSAIPIASIASASKHPERVIGMHYFSPVPRMPLLEVVVTPQTADWVTATVANLGRLQGKTVIVVKDGPGFYTTRILMTFFHEALALLQERANVEAVDDAMRHFGFPIGPFKLLDEVGLDVGAHVAEELHGFFAARGFEKPVSLQRLLHEGLLGRKSGSGFYRYEPSGWKEKLPFPAEKSRPVNPEIYRAFGSESRKTVDMLEIQERMVLMMVNEAVFCFEEGILQSPRDGDVGAVLGLGFPPFLGGPFRYLDRIGPAEAVIKLERLAEKFGPRFLPAPLLNDMAMKGETFYKGD